MAQFRVKENGKNTHTHTHTHTHYSIELQMYIECTCLCIVWYMVQSKRTVNWRARACTHTHTHTHTPIQDLERMDLPHQSGQGTHLLSVSSMVGLTRPLSNHSHTSVINHRLTTLVVPSPTSWSCKSASSTSTLAAGCSTSRSFSMVAPSFVTVTS